MSALLRVRCAGAPRDLGLDQGTAARAAIRAVSSAGLAARLRALLAGGRARSAARDLERFFPHHAERMQGLSLGARVPANALLERLGELLAGDGGLAAAVSSARAPGALVARSLVGAVDALVLRQSAPDNDYRSLELAAAASPAAWIGVNEHGLAATATALPAPDESLDGCAAPAQLLVQDVLQRFDTVEKAVEWALRRPAGGHASLLLADASGRVAAVEIEGRQRRVLGAGEAFLTGFGPAAAVAALEKAGAEVRSFAADSLARLLGEASTRPAPARNSHQAATAAAHLGGLSRDSSLRALDVATATPPLPSVGMASDPTDLRGLATHPGENCGLVAVADPTRRRLGVARGVEPLLWYELAR